MKTSDEGLKMIRQAEGCVLHIYKDQAGLDTIGVGHLLTMADKSSGRFNDGITEEQAMDLLREDVASTEKHVSDLVSVPLTQNQFDALVDFTFNVGRTALATSTLLKRLNAGDYAAVPSEMAKWNKITTFSRDQATKKIIKKRIVLEGLVKRRKREGDLWSRV